MLNAAAIPAASLQARSSTPLSLTRSTPISRPPSGSIVSRIEPSNSIASSDR
jgi:hypothetical protein